MAWTRLDTTKEGSAPNILRGLLNVRSLDKNDAPSSTDALMIGSTQMAKLLYPGEDVGRNARRIFDSMSASEQCIALGIPNEKCWICGNSFSDVFKEFGAQCDHILPVIQAIIFLELYGSKGTEITKAMKLEYAWAHALCNQAKSNKLFITADAYSGNWVLDETIVNSLLENIKSKGIALDIDSRRNDIKNKIDPILDYLNKHGSRTFNLQLLAGMSGIIGGYRKTFKRKSNEFSKSGRSKGARRINVSTASTTRNRRTSNRKRTSKRR